MKPNARYPRRRSYCLQLILTTAVLLVTATAFAAERTSLKILAIGNSFSDDATVFLPALAEAGRKQLVLGRASIGGCSLERHARHLHEAESGHPEARAYKGFVDPISQKKRDVTLVEALTAAEWEMVTLQQVSHQSFLAGSFQPHLDQLVAAVRKYAPAAEIVLHETWAYREDHPFFQQNNGFTPLKMYQDIRANYHAIADEKSFRLLPVGDAFHLARQTPRRTYVADPTFDFKNPPAGQLPDQHTSLNIGWHWFKNPQGDPVLNLDAIHCNTAGKYLGACVWYLELFGADAIPSGFTPKDLPSEDAAILRTHALAAVQAERARPAKPPAQRTP